MKPLQNILIAARARVANEEFSVRDAVYESAVNGESDSAAMLALKEAGLRFGVMPHSDVLAVFDRAIAAEGDG